MGIQLFPAPEIEAPKFRALVLAIRKLFEESPFNTMEELGKTLKPSRTRQRLSELARGVRLPDEHELRAIVAACRPRAWLVLEQLLADARAERSARAAEPVSQLSDRVVVGSVTNRLPIVGEYNNWDVLGVHRSIAHVTHAGSEDLADRLLAGELPAYVLREKDVEPGTGLRPVLAAMAAGIGPAVRLVLITGESSAGKTRAAVEAMRAHLGSWRLLIPYGAEQLEEILDDRLDLGHVVVWMDEIQEFLSETAGSAQLKRLMALPTGPTVLLATLRTDAENACRHSAGWRLLNQRAHRITLYRRPPGGDHERELSRARELTDPRIVEALAKIGNRYGIAEWLAAGPQLIIELERGHTGGDSIATVGSAIVEAAIDCNRAGYTTPIPEALLYEAHHLYLGDRAVKTPQDVFRVALVWARQPVAGASGLLEHHRARGDQAFDYLLSHAAHRAAPIPSPLWTILLRHTTPNTLPTIAVAAHRNGRESVAHELASRQPTAELSRAIGDDRYLRRLSETGNENAALLLLELLLERGDVEGLTRQADAGCERTGVRLAELLARRGDVVGLAARAASGDLFARSALAKLLAERGDVEGLTARAAAGDVSAASALANVLGEMGDVDGLAAQADSGCGLAESALANLFYEMGDSDKLTRRADTGHKYAARWLAELLAGRGDVEELTRRADAGDQDAARRLAELLHEMGDVAGLAARANTGEWRANPELAELLYEIGDVAGLAARAHAGDWFASAELARLLVERGDVEELTRRADAGDDNACEQLAELLAERGDAEELARRADSGDEYATDLMKQGRIEELARQADADHERMHDRHVQQLAQRRDFKELERWADAGDDHAARCLAAMLADQEDVEGLVRRAGAGDAAAARRLAELLAKRGDVEELTRRADTGDDDAARRLAELFVERGDVEELTRRADTGDTRAAYRLAQMLADQGNIDELIRRADSGDDNAGYWLCEILVARGDVEKLTLRADVGDIRAAWQLAEPLTQLRHLDVSNRCRPVSAPPLTGAHLPQLAFATDDASVDAGAVPPLQTGAAAAELAAGGTWVCVEPGAHVIRQGDTGDFFYVVAWGQLEAERDDTAVATLHAGDFFGETALLSDAPQTVTVRALTPTLLFAVSSSIFDRVVRSSFQPADLISHLVLPTNPADPTSSR